MTQTKCSVFHETELNYPDEIYTDCTCGEAKGFWPRNRELAFFHVIKVIAAASALIDESDEHFLTDEAREVLGPASMLLYTLREHLIQHEVNRLYPEVEKFIKDPLNYAEQRG